MTNKAAHKLYARLLALGIKRTAMAEAMGVSSQALYFAQRRGFSGAMRKRLEDYCEQLREAVK
jgi:hypothetical protein